MRIIISDKIIGGDFKFKDYYSAYGLQLPLKFDLRNESFTEKQINLIDKYYKISSDMIRKKQCELLINFPYRIKNEYLLSKNLCIKSYFNS